MSSESETRGKRLYLRIAAVAGILGVLIFVVVGGTFLLHAGKIFPGVRVLGKDFGSLNKKEALSRLKDLKRDVEERDITLKLGAKARVFNVNELGISFNTEKTLERLMKCGRGGGWLRQWHERAIIAQAGREIEPVLNVKQDVLKKMVREFAGTRLVPAEDARFDTSGDRVRIVPGQEGTDIDWLSFYMGIQRSLAPRGERSVTVVIKTLEPKVKASDLAKMNINSLLSSNTTHFDPTKANRAYNIKTAASALDGHILAPNAVFSFNSVVGPRSTEAGYKNAPVIENNELVDGLGGGVCQVSTTLYGAALKADLAVMERSSHSLVVSYVPLGQDATVVYGALDMKLKNPYQDYLLIKAEVAGDRVTFKIFGNREYQREVLLFNEVIKTWSPKTVYERDDTLPAGTEKVKQPGHNGYVVRSYRVVKKNGVVVRRDTLPQSYYEAQSRIILVGTRAVSTGRTPASGNDSPAGGGSSSGGGGGTNPPPYGGDAGGDTGPVDDEDGGNQGGSGGGTGDGEPGPGDEGSGGTEPGGTGDNGTGEGDDGSGDSAGEG